MGELEGNQVKENFERTDNRSSEGGETHVTTKRSHACSASLLPRATRSRKEHLTQIQQFPDKKRKCADRFLRAARGDDSSADTEPGLVGPGPGLPSFLCVPKSTMCEHPCKQTAENSDKATIWCRGLWCYLALIRVPGLD